MRGDSGLSLSFSSLGDWSPFSFFFFIDEGGDDTAVTGRSRRRQTPKPAVTFAWHTCATSEQKFCMVQKPKTHANLGMFRGIGFKRNEGASQRTRFELVSWGADDDQTGTRISFLQVREDARKMSIWVSANWLFFIILNDFELTNKISFISSLIFRVIIKWVFKFHAKKKK